MAQGHCDAGPTKRGLVSGRPRLKCTGTGSYTSPYFKVPATGTFVVYYYEDDWYCGGFTSTAKVTVR